MLVIKVSKLEVKRELLKSSFFDFVSEFWSTVIAEKLIPNWHIKYLCQRMQAIAERVFAGEDKKYDLVANVPPGTSKSSIVSVFFPAWVWTRMPSARVLGASYTHNLALDLSRKCRDVVTSDEYKRLFPNIVIRTDQGGKAYFMNTKGGMRLSVGSGGSPLGFHFHFLLIDDPINPQEVLSEVVLKNTNDWIDRQISTRKIDAKISVMILIMQRLAQSDPAAEMLKRNRVSHICLPATDEFKIHPESLKKYYVDGLLDPKRLPPEVLDEWRSRGDYFFSGQFGQDPIPLGGGLFKTDMLKYGIPGKMLKVVRYWDKAGTLGGGDWTVGLKMGMDYSQRLWVLDVIRVRMDSYSREKMMRKVAENDGTKVQIGIEQEPGSAGKESGEASARTLIGFSVKLNSVSGKGEKQIRWDPFSTQVNAGNVYLVEGSWNHDFVEELRFAPFGTHDDQCLREGTLIQTERGDIPVEEVTPEDRVRTRRGWRKVVCAGQTGETSKTVTIDTTAGDVLKCTPNHPVFTTNRGWIPAGRMTTEDEVLVWRPWSKSRSGTAVSGGDILTRNEGTIGSTFSVTRDGKVLHSSTTVRSGKKLTTKKSRKGGKSITKTEILSTTNSTISNVSREQFTVPAIVESVPRSRGGISKFSGRKLPSGTSPKPAASGIGKTGRSVGRNFQCDPSSVRSVENHFALELPTRSSVAGSVGVVPPTGIANRGSPSSKESVCGVRRSFTKSNPAGSFVTSRVRRITVSTHSPEKVYNLSVKDVHEYVADGVLVHNCDSASGALTLLIKGRARVGGVKKGGQLRRKVDKKQEIVVKYMDDKNKPKKKPQMIFA